MAMAMIQVANHADFKASFCYESNGAAIRHQAVPLERFSEKMLNKILEAFGEEPEQTFTEGMTERDFLINEIKANCNKRQWDCASNFLLVIGLGRGQLIQSLNLADPDKADLDELEERARMFIAQHSKLLCILDTDMVTMTAPKDSGLEPTVSLQEQLVSRRDPDNADRLEQLTAMVKDLQRDLTQARNVNIEQAEQIRQQRALLNQTSEEYAVNQNQAAEDRRTEDIIGSTTDSLLDVSKYSEEDSYESASIRSNQLKQGGTKRLWRSGSYENRRKEKLQEELQLTKEALTRTQDLLEQSRIRHDELRSYLINLEDRPSETSTDREYTNRRTTSHEDRPPLQGVQGTNTTRNQHRRPYKAWTLKMLNIQKFNPERSDIITHVERVTKILEEADVRPESQKIRLLVASFPEQYDHMERAVSASSRNSYRRFSKELVKIMGSKVRIASHRFMDCHRQRGEDVLQFFFRVCSLYKSSKGLMGDEWQNNPVHASQIYSKLHQSLYQSEQIVLERELDRHVERGTLTVARLTMVLIEINKNAQEKIQSETSSKHALLPLQADIESQQTVFQHTSESETSESN